MKGSPPETSGQIVQGSVNGAIGTVLELVQDALNEGRRHAAAARRLQEMPRHDRIEGGVAAVADGHRQLHAVMRDLAGILNIRFIVSENFIRVCAYGRYIR
jgi:hypothetical protein